MDGRILFALPATPLVRVTYFKQGVRYEAVLPNPRTNDRLKAVMLARNVGLSAVASVSPMAERKERRLITR